MSVCVRFVLFCFVLCGGDNAFIDNTRTAAADEMAWLMRFLEGGLDKRCLKKHGGSLMGHEPRGLLSIVAVPKERTLDQGPVSSKLSLHPASQPTSQPNKPNRPKPNRRFQQPEAPVLSFGRAALRASVPTFTFATPPVFHSTRPRTTRLRRGATVSQKLGAANSCQSTLGPEGSKCLVQTR